MRKVVYINENYRFIKNEKDINEGGFSRNYYLMKWFQNNVVNLKEIRLGRNLLLNIFKVVYQLLSPKKTTIVFQYPLLGIPIFNNYFFTRITNKAVIYMFKLALKNKYIIFDISDLKYEQCIDLNINKDVVKTIKEFESDFFSLSAKFVFASKSMKNYAQTKYNIPSSNADVCINGSREINSQLNWNSTLDYIDSDKINFVYAGSLNKGRQIETMLSKFPINNKIQMIIMGSDGEWIPKILKQKNILYLGPLPEEDAHRISSRCDIGLIPYDSSKMYYNLAYPTKLSFYITAGIPFLATPVQEVLRVNKDYDIGFICNFDKLENFYSNLSQEMISQEKIKINKIKKKFTWEQVIIDCNTYRYL